MQSSLEQGEPRLLRLPPRACLEGRGVSCAGDTLCALDVGARENLEHAPRPSTRRARGGGIGGHQGAGGGEEAEHDTRADPLASEPGLNTTANFIIAPPRPSPLPRLQRRAVSHAIRCGLPLACYRHTHPRRISSGSDRVGSRAQCAPPTPWRRSTLGQHRRKTGESPGFGVMTPPPPPPTGVQPPSRRHRWDAQKDSGPAPPHAEEMGG